MRSTSFSKHTVREILSLALTAIPASTHATEGGNYPPGFTSTVVASSLVAPTSMAIASEEKIFVGEQGGDLRLVKNGVLLPRPFASVSVNSQDERGLLGVACDPNFALNGYVYVYYTSTSPYIHNKVSRFTASGDTAMAGSEFVVLDLDEPASRWHNGGEMDFGLDNKLYIGTGDNATTNNSQTLGSLYGKILRLNSDGTVPPDNPFYSQATGTRRSIWALGLRNPFTFAFQSGTGRLFINDVGQSSWEEINDGIPGSNYGWPITEGYTGDPRFRSPLYAYPHGNNDTSGCAILGGAFYNPPVVQFPASYVGDYFFADHCGGWIRIYRPSTGSVRGFATGLNQTLDLKVSSDGSLYILGRTSSSGILRRVQYSSTAVNEQDSHPEKFRLYQNYPNPFNPSTTIHYQVGRTSFVTLKVFNVLGQEVATLANAEREPGSYAVHFPTNISESNLASGVYFYRLQAEGINLIRRMIIIK